MLKPIAFFSKFIHSFRCQQLVKREHWIMENLQAFIVKNSWAHCFIQKRCYHQLMNGIYLIVFFNEEAQQLGNNNYINIIFR